MITIARLEIENNMIFLTEIFVNFELHIALDLRDNALLNFEERMSNIKIQGSRVKW